MSSGLRVCLLGFGEVGQVLAADLIARGVANPAAWDLKFVDASSSPSLACTSIGVRRATDPRDAVAGADLIVSAVTAAQDVEAARSVAPHIGKQAFFLDVNSVSPGVKRHVAEIIGAVGATYVEAVIMSPILPLRMEAPMLFGGPSAATFLAEEMREVARTVSEAGLEPWMSTACAQRQDWASHRREAASHEDLDAMLDAILAADRKG